MSEVQSRAWLQGQPRLYSLPSQGVEEARIDRGKRIDGTIRASPHRHRPRTSPTDQELKVSASVA
jgi:hypothetical protein